MSSSAKCVVRQRYTLYGSDARKTTPIAGNSSHRLRCESQRCRYQINRKLCPPQIELTHCGRSLLNTGRDGVYTAHVVRRKIRPPQIERRKTRSLRFTRPPSPHSLRSRGRGTSRSTVGYESTGNCVRPKLNSLTPCGRSLFNTGRDGIYTAHVVRRKIRPPRIERRKTRSLRFTRPPSPHSLRSRGRGTSRSTVGFESTGKEVRPPRTELTHSLRSFAAQYGSGRSLHCSRCSQGNPPSPN